MGQPLWSCPPSNRSTVFLTTTTTKKPIVPKFLAQILKEQEWTNISNRISWSGFSGAKQGGGLKLANFEK